MPVSEVKDSSHLELVHNGIFVYVYDLLEVSRDVRHRHMGGTWSGADRQREQ